MHELWKRVRTYGVTGVLWLDPDVAADPDDYGAMVNAIESIPHAMHTGMVKLWPESTGLDHWIWSHRPGSVGSPVATQDETAPVSYVATGFLYTPARLLDLVFPALADGQWIDVDVTLSEVAMVNGIAAHAVTGCRPKHLHFRKEHDGDYIYRQQRQQREDQ
jgi:hypothetical protein